MQVDKVHIRNKLRVHRIRVHLDLTKKLLAFVHTYGGSKFTCNFSSSSDKIECKKTVIGTEEPKEKTKNFKTAIVTGNQVYYEDTRSQRWIEYLADFPFHQLNEGSYNRKSEEFMKYIYDVSEKWFNVHGPSKGRGAQAMSEERGVAACVEEYERYLDEDDISWMIHAIYPTKLVNVQPLATKVTKTTGSSFILLSLHSMTRYYLDTCAAESFEKILNKLDELKKKLIEERETARNANSPPPADAFLPDGSGIYQLQDGNYYKHHKQGEPIDFYNYDGWTKVEYKAWYADQIFTFIPSTKICAYEIQDKDLKAGFLSILNVFRYVSWNTCNVEDVMQSLLYNDHGFTDAYSALKLFLSRSSQDDSILSVFFWVGKKEISLAFLKQLFHELNKIEPSSSNPVPKEPKEPKASPDTIECDLMGRDRGPSPPPRNNWVHNLLLGNISGEPPTKVRMRRLSNNDIQVQLSNGSYSEPFRFIDFAQSNVASTSTSVNNKVFAGKIEYGDVSDLMIKVSGDKTTKYHMFQAASQFNVLEMASVNYTPQHGVQIYSNDHTQGPAVAIAAGFATLYRNYGLDPTTKNLFGEDGQMKTQFNGLRDVLQSLSVRNNPEWQSPAFMKNGYFIPKSSLLADYNSNEELRGAMKLLRVGVHPKVQLTSRNFGSTSLPRTQKQFVGQVFVSACPIAYSQKSVLTWGKFSKDVLKQAYLLTLLAASTVPKYSVPRDEIIDIWFTLVGAGAFGNPSKDVIEAIDDAVQEFKTMKNGLKVRVNMNLYSENVLPLDQEKQLRELLARQQL